MARRHRWFLLHDDQTHECAECGLQRQRPMGGGSGWEYNLDGRWYPRLRVPPCPEGSPPTGEKGNG
jgi:hypothetical protein